MSYYTMLFVETFPGEEKAFTYPDEGGDVAFKLSDGLAAAQTMANETNKIVRAEFELDYATVYEYMYPQGQQQ